MVILAVGAFASGLANLPEFSFIGVPKSWMSDLLTGHGEPFPTGIAASSSIIAAVGIVIAYAVYVTGHVVKPEAIASAFKPIHQLLVRKYYMDDIYETGIVKKVGNGRSWPVGGDIFDRNVVDRIVNWVGEIGRQFGGGIAKLQTGQVQVYGVGIFIGLIVIMAVFWFATGL